MKVSDFLIILVCAVWTLFCIGIVLYLNLDRMRAHTQMLWKRYKPAAEEWLGGPITAKRPADQIRELIKRKNALQLPEPDWWSDFVNYYNESAERYSARMRAPVFRRIAALLRFQEMPKL